MRLRELVLRKDNNEILIEMPHSEAIIAGRVLTSVMRKYMRLSFDMSGHTEKRYLPYDDERRKSLRHHDPEKDRPREEGITKEELFSLFNKVLKNPEHKNKILAKKKYGKEIEGVIRDHESDVNVVFKVAFQHKSRYPLFRIITLMRKKGFTPKRGDIVINV